MKLLRNTCSVTLFIISLLIFANQINAANIEISQKEKNKQQKINLTEQQKIEFDYAFAEAIKFRLLGDINKAVSWYANCIKIDPESAAAHFELANIYMEQKDYTSSLDLARKAVELQPKNIWYQIQLAQVYQEKGMIDHACAVYDNLIKYHPEKNDFYYLQAALYASVEKREEAIEVYNKLEKKIGITEPISIEKERLYIAMNKKKMAYKELQKLIKTFPDNADLYGLLADLYLSDNQEEKAFKQYKKILELEPDNGLVHFYLSDYYQKKGDNSEAYNEMMTAFKHPKIEADNKIQYLMSTLMNSEQSYIYEEQQIKELLDQLITIHPNNIPVLALYVDYLRKKEKHEEARIYLRKIIEQEKGNYIVWEEILLIDNQLLDFKSMYHESAEALKYFPEKPLLYMFNGLASLQLEKFDEAIQNFKSGLDYTVDNETLKVQFLSYLGEAYYKKEDTDNAFKTFDEVLSLDPDNIVVLNNYSYYLSLKGEQLEKAENMSYKCVKMEENNSTYLDTYAWVLYMKGKYSEAKPIMERALENGGHKSAVVLEHYGDILYRLGEKNKALEEWKKAKKIGDDSETKTLIKKVKTGKIPDEILKYEK